MLSNEEFYDRLAAFYDIMNDWSARLAYEGPFIRRTLEAHGTHSVLDAACGTGQHSLALRDWGYEPSGADSSPQMIHHAQATAKSRGVDVPFFVSDFAALPGLPGAPFDAVLCLGNSLPHVETDEALDASLDGLSEALRARGVLILHNLNYDKRWIERPRFFKLDSGVIDGEEALVWRLADYGDTHITFHTALFQRGRDGQWEVQVNSTPQKPLFHKDLEERLHERGFANVTAYGNLKGEPFDATSSGDLVLVAIKQPGSA